MSLNAPLSKIGAPLSFPLRVIGRFSKILLLDPCTGPREEYCIHLWDL